MVKPKAIVDKEKCLACGGCISVCPQDSISWIGNKAFVTKEKCISCKICFKTCPVGAISMEDY
jgi:Fe-S-cluster-containing hydrogenase component 2